MPGLTIEGHEYSQAELDAMDPFERDILLESAGENEDDLKALAGEGDAPGSASAPAAAPAAAPTAPAAAPAAQAPAAPKEGADAAALAAEVAAAPAAAPAAAAPAPEATESLLGELKFNLPTPSLRDVTTLQTAAEAARTAETEGFKKMMDGTMESGDYLELKTKAEAATRALDRAEIENGNIKSRYEERALEAFGSMEKAALDQLKAAGVDLDAIPDGRQSFMGYVEAFSNALLKQNIGDGSDMKNSRMSVERAMTAIAAEHGVVLKGKAAAAVAAAAKPGAAPAPTRRAPDLSGIPPTLSGAPMAGSAEVDTNLFAHIDAITDFDEQEIAIARLTDAQREQYLASAGR